MYIKWRYTVYTLKYTSRLKASKVKRIIWYVWRMWAINRAVMSQLCELFSRCLSKYINSMINNILLMHSNFINKFIMIILLIETNSINTNILIYILCELFHIFNSMYKRIDAKEWTRCCTNVNIECTLMQNNSVVCILRVCILRMNLKLKRYNFEYVHLACNSL